MELENFTRLTADVVRQQAFANDVMLLFVFRDEADPQVHILQLYDVARSGRPVLVAFDLPAFHQPVQHEDGIGLVLPDHEPEVADRRLQRTLRQDVTAAGLLNFDETGIDVVVAAGQPDAAVVICEKRQSDTIPIADCGYSQGVTSRYRFKSLFSLFLESLLVYSKLNLSAS